MLSNILLVSVAVFGCLYIVVADISHSLPSTHPGLFKINQQTAQPIRAFFSVISSQIIPRNAGKVIQKPLMPQAKTGTPTMLVKKFLVILISVLPTLGQFKQTNNFLETFNDLYCGYIFSCGVIIESDEYDIVSDLSKKYPDCCPQPVPKQVKRSSDGLFRLNHMQQTKKAKKNICLNKKCY